MVIVALLDDIARRVRESPSYTCPRCGAMSYNPNDLRERYGGRCHAFEELIDWTSGAAILTWGVGVPLAFFVGEIRRKSVGHSPRKS